MMKGSEAASVDVVSVPDPLTRS